jgi:hypothetical protein
MLLIHISIISKFISRQIYQVGQNAESWLLTKRSIKTLQKFPDI